MTREELKQLMQELMGFASPEHQARTTDILASISDGFETTMTESEQAQNRISELTANNETLRDVNAKLFLKVGAPAKDADTTPEPTPNEPDKIGFDTLFNEKGELI